MPQVKQNKYDDDHFFSAYENMPRSVNGLEGAGEWHILRSLMPDFKNKAVLDLGCGFGWHCRYASERGAESVIGVDISEKMIEKASEMTADEQISYLKMPIEDIAFLPSQFDVVLSSLAFHYVQSFAEVCNKIYRYLKLGGTFLFSVEHPIFTSREEQDWYYDENGNRLHWAVDHYQSEGQRKTSFLTDNVIKYHRTLSTYINTLIEAGFTIRAVKEPIPAKEMIKNSSEMKDELRRPMFLILLAEK